ncbi:hypothetical protein [Galbibacter mesophilus]|uniref:hypothetical protein n=1 Tax=Galbibacter mesophilus TaxID=379069 RepID=UPI0019201174|nr:hypothetical protein [Galbibacter mesophilus]MCM5663136.1 hypothetical protein [Galbibacter mesophilus]
MASLTISDKILEKYFGYLKTLDMNTKKILIRKLSRSIEAKSKKKTDLAKMYGAWQDDRTSDEIISEIRSSRVEKSSNDSF